MLVLIAVADPIFQALILPQIDQRIDTSLLPLKTEFFPLWGQTFQKFLVLLLLSLAWEELR